MDSGGKRPGRPDLADPDLTPRLACPQTCRRTVANAHGVPLPRVFRVHRSTVCFCPDDDVPLWLEIASGMDRLTA